ncbi:hypothetical protein [Microbacterium sp. SORGH_AS_0505]|uniref:hypothetical protein n=1 Tax=Microbacterium sp. SORGH_AS_0505 TaxID=3041770 RepID=UPI0027D8B9C1|nr:hypothetical protein [Microbacterium sp. SORGH_AS_0505]
MIEDELVRMSTLGCPVEIERGRAGETFSRVRGIVVGVEGNWLALQALVDSVYFDGYFLLPIRDITAVVEDTENGYVSSAIEALGRPTVDYHLPADASVSSVLQTANAHSRLIALSIEADDDQALFVGKVVERGSDVFSMLLINRAGVWSDEPAELEYSDVTRIDFGDRYCAALARFGDPAPQTDDNS